MTEEWEGTCQQCGKVYLVVHSVTGVFACGGCLTCFTAYGTCTIKVERKDQDERS